MVALKAELGPPGAYVPGMGVPDRFVYVAAGADALPGTGTALGTFEHYSPTDPLHKHGPNHVVFHHIRDILYKKDRFTPASPAMWPYGFHDFQGIKIQRYGAIMTSTAITAAPVTMAVAATATLAVKLQPGDVASAAADNDFTSNNPAIATVAATGVVTGVAPGTTTVRITHKINGLYTEANISVTPTARSIEEEQEAIAEANQKANEAEEAKETEETKARKAKEAKEAELAKARQAQIEAEEDDEVDEKGSKTGAKKPQSGQASHTSHTQPHKK